MIMRRILWLWVVLFATVLSINAQERRERGPQHSREEMVLDQAKKMADRITLEKSKRDKFIETYRKYQDELWAANPRMHDDKAHKKDKAEKKDKAKDRRFDDNRKAADNIREKYRKEFGKMLTPEQLDKLFKYEGQRMGNGPRRQQGNHFGAERGANPGNHYGTERGGNRW